MLVEFHAGAHVLLDMQQLERFTSFKISDVAANVLTEGASMYPRRRPGSEGLLPCGQLWEGRRCHPGAAYNGR